MMNRNQLSLCSAVAGVMLCLLPYAADAQGKDATAIIAKACATELEADHTDKSAFMYRDHDITPDHDTTLFVVETPQGNLHRKLEDHGRPLTAAERQEDDASIKKLLNDPGLQKRLRHDSNQDDQQAEELLKLLPVAFIWTLTGETPETYTLNFKPDSKYDAPNMEARVFGDMAGTVVVSKADNHIVSMRGRMVDDVKILGGIVGRLHKGGTFQVEHREVAPHHWQLTELHVHIAGHILFNFKTIGSQEDEVKTDFKLSTVQTLQQAWEIASKVQ